VHRPYREEMSVSQAERSTTTTSVTVNYLGHLTAAAAAHDKPLTPASKHCVWECGLWDGVLKTCRMIQYFAVKVKSREKEYRFLTENCLNILRSSSVAPQGCCILAPGLLLMNYGPHACREATLQH